MRDSCWKVYAATALVFFMAAACYNGGFDPWGEEASLSLTWAINDAPADADACEAAGAATVRMSINTSREPWYDNMLEWNCSRGWVVLDTLFAVGDYYLQWELLDANRQILKTTPWVRMLLVRGENSYDVDFYTD